MKVSLYSNLSSTSTMNASTTSQDQYFEGYQLYNHSGDLTGTKLHRASGSFYQLFGKNNLPRSILTAVFNRYLCFKESLRHDRQCNSNEIWDFPGLTRQLHDQRSRMFKSRYINTVEPRRCTTNHGCLKANGKAADGDESTL